MLIRFKLTKRDYYLSSFWTAATSKAIWLAIILVPFGFLVTILQPQTLIMLVLIAASGVVLFLICFITMVYLSILSKLKKEGNLLLNNQIIDLKSDGVFYFSSEGGKGIYSPFILKLIESPWHFYLYLTEKQIILVPKTGLNLQEFRKLAKSLIITLSKLRSLIVR